MFSKFARPAARAVARLSSSAGKRSAVVLAPFATRGPTAVVAAAFAAAAFAAAAATSMEVQLHAQEENQGGAFESLLSQDAKQHLEDAKKLLSESAQAVRDAPKQVLWNAIRKDVEDIIDDEKSLNPGADGFPGNSGGGGDVGPMLVRLAWHSAGSYDKDSGTGGTNGGTMRFSPEADHGGNAGLGHARALLEPIKAKYGKFGVTYADIYAFAGGVAIEAMGGPSIPFRPGRTDADKVASPEEDKRFSPDGRLPDADGRNTDPANHLRDIFHRMGFNDREIVTLSGAHALGRCHTDRSGYWGPWTNAPTTFSNEYFVKLQDEDWFIKRTHKGGPWTGPLQYEDKTGELMMLPTDYVLLNDREFRPVVREYAADEAKFFDDFRKVFTTLMELGCEGVLDNAVIVNLEAEAGPVKEAAREKVGAAVEKFKQSLGEVKEKAKKKGWFW